MDLLRALARDPRAPYDAVGAATGLSGNAVKARLARLREEGVLQGIHALPRAAHLGLREGLLVFDRVDDAAEREEELLRGLPEVPGILHADVGHDSVHAHVLFRDDADWERIERAAISLTGKPPAHRVQLPPSDAPHLAPADWRILDALLTDGRLPLGELARVSDLSPKTVRRRLAALLEHGDIILEPILSPAEAHGFALAHAIVDAPEDAALPEGVFTLAPRARLLHVYAARESLREAHAALSAVRAIPGVQRALPIVGTRRSAEGWLKDAVAAARVRVAPAPELPAAPPTVRR